MIRLDEVNVDDYGPLEEHLEFDEGLEVVYGPNESGKTLLVDALLMLLTGRNEDDRVGQDPIGYVRLTEGDGSRRLEDDETVMDRFEVVEELNLGASEFRNTFVVRSADSQLTSEDEYYDRATDIVAESLVDDIERVRDAVRTCGRITPTGMLINRSTDLQTRDHLSTAKEVRGKLDEFLAEARDSDVPDLEADLFEAEQAVVEKTKELERLEAARDRQEFETQSENRDRLDEILGNLNDLPDEQDLNNLETDVGEAVEAEETISTVESRRDDARTLARRALVATVIALVGGLSVGIWMLSSVGPSLLGLIALAFALALVTAIPGAIAWYFWQTREGAESELAEVQSQRTSVLQRGRDIGLEAEDVSELSSIVSDKLRQYRDLRSEAQELHGELNGVLGLSSDNPEETLEQATAELVRRESEIDEAVSVEFTEEALETAERELAELEGTRDSLDEKLQEIRVEIQGYADAIGDLPFSEYGLSTPRTTVETLEGLESVGNRLDDLIETIETEADNARATDDLLEELKEDEQSRVGDLFFGAESAVSDYFSRITDGRYENVGYDEHSNELRVHASNDTELTPGQLSQSTFDQLYFAVRIAFAQEILDASTGFFVLDDAFLASDADRLERQIDILGDIVDEGWQVIYFTAKDFDRDVFSDRIGSRIQPLDTLG